MKYSSCQGIIIIKNKKAKLLVTVHIIMSVGLFGLLNGSIQNQYFDKHHNLHHDEEIKGKAPKLESQNVVF